MKRYDKCKDSGIEWIGEIPSHWESWKISHAFNRIGSGTTPESGNPIYHENGTVNWLNTGDLNDGFLDSCSKQITQKALEDYSSLKLFPAGSLVIAMYGATIGKTAILNFETTTNQACCVFCESEIINLRFLQYWFIGNKEQIINLAIGGGQPNISQNILKDIRLWCPDYSEQLSLNNYLDQKTSQIDDLIAKKERLIQLLEEERTAIINQAVTKGLDPTVPMKDSGIEWLGEIPAHWGRARIKTLVKIKVCDGPHETPEWKEDGIPFISAEAIKGNQIDLNFKRGYISEEQHQEYCKKSKVQKGDILFCKSGSTTGKSALVEIDDEFGIWSPLAIIRVDERKISNRYMFQSIQSSLFRNQVETSWTFGTQPNIGMGALENLWIAIPPLNEQELIDEYLISELKNFDAIIAKTIHEIELLKEYKTALISEVVTGKVDVRNEKLS